MSLFHHYFLAVPHIDAVWQLLHAMTNTDTSKTIYGGRFLINHILRPVNACRVTIIWRDDG